MLPSRKLGSGWGWLEQLHFLAIKLFLNASSDQKKGIWLNEPEMLTIAHQNNSIKKIRWFDLILFKKSWACLPFGSPFFVTPLLLKSSCNLPHYDYNQNHDDHNSSCKSPPALITTLLLPQPTCNHTPSRMKMDYQPWCVLPVSILDPILIILIRFWSFDPFLYNLTPIWSKGRSSI